MMPSPTDHGQQLLAYLQAWRQYLEHTAGGNPKLLKRCTLPLTGAGVVALVITDLGVFEVGEAGLRLVDIAPEVTVEEIRSKTEAEFTVSPDLKLAA